MREGVREHVDRLASAVELDRAPFVVDHRGHFADHRVALRAQVPVGVQPVDHGGDLQRQHAAASAEHARLAHAVAVVHAVPDRGAVALLPINRRERRGAEGRSHPVDPVVGKHLGLRQRRRLEREGMTGGAASRQQRAPQHGEGGAQVCPTSYAGRSPMVRHRGHYRAAGGRQLLPCALTVDTSTDPRCRPSGLFACVPGSGGVAHRTPDVRSGPPRALLVAAAGVALWLTRRSTHPGSGGAGVSREPLSPRGVRGVGWALVRRARAAWLQPHLPASRGAAGDAHGGGASRCSSRLGCSNVLCAVSTARRRAGGRCGSRWRPSRTSGSGASRSRWAWPSRLPVFSSSCGPRVEAGTEGPGGERVRVSGSGSGLAARSWLSLRRCARQAAPWRGCCWRSWPSRTRS